MSASTRPPVIHQAPRLLFFGMAGALSSLALDGLLAAGLPVAAVVMPGLPGPAADPISRRSPPPARAPLHLVGPPARPTLAAMAEENGRPLYSVTRLGHPATLTRLAAEQPDLIVVVCYPHRLPAELLALARLGGLNLHPSALPAGRGPAPRFWTFRHGLSRGGVTIHQLTDRLDAGPVLNQTTFALPDGLSGHGFDELAAQHGTRLLVEAIQALAAGTAQPRPQEPALVRYDPWPGPADYLVTTDRPARWAYNFMRGVAGDGGPLAVVVNQQPVPAVAATGFEPAGQLGRPYLQEGSHLWLQCTPGILGVRLAPGVGPVVSYHQAAPRRPGAPTSR